MSLLKAGLSFRQLAEKSWKIPDRFEKFEVGAREGFKLEERVRITETGWELVANYPFEDELLD